MTEPTERDHQWGCLSTLPIFIAEQLSGQLGLRQVIVIGLNQYDDTAHIITFGKGAEDCRLVDETGNNIKRYMGWPQEWRTVDEAIAAAREDARAEERERCAAIADEFTRFQDQPDYADAPKLIASKIRSGKLQEVRSEDEK